MTKSATLEDFLDAYFGKLGDRQGATEFYRKTFKNIMTDSNTSVGWKVETALSHIVKESSPHGTDPYYKRFVNQFERKELERIFGQDLYGKLILVKQLYEDRRLREIPHPSQHLTYLVNLLPAVLIKADSKEDILRWDEAVKDIFLDYAKLYHPYGIAPALRNIILNCVSFEMLDKARQLIKRVKGEAPSKFGIFIAVLSLVQGKVKEPRRLEEWYQPVIDVINKYERIGEQSHFDPLSTFIETHNKPKDLYNFSPWSR